MNSSDCHKIRYDLWLSQRAFAKIVGIGVASVTKYETGKAEPEKTPLMIYKLLQDDPDLIIKMYKINKHKLNESEARVAAKLYREQWGKPKPRSTIRITAGVHF